MESIIVRKATISDVETLLLFEQGVIAAERPFDSTLKSEYIHYYDIAHMIEAKHIELVVAESRGELVGCGYARIENSMPYLQHSRHAYLGFMYVIPEYRGKGVNKLIVQELMSWAASKEITEMRLEVYIENEGAVKAYEKAGFSKHVIQMRCKVDSFPRD